MLRSTSPQRITEWLTCSALIGLVVTVLEAILLERKYGLLRGGFLADVHLQGGLDWLVFFSASLLADVAAASFLVALLIALCRRLEFGRWTRRTALLGLGAFPFAAFNLVAYQLHLYLGDMMNLGLLFDLSGRSVAELLAVGGSHILVVVGALVACAGAVVVSVTTVSRFSTASPGAADTKAPAAWKLVAFVLAAMLVTTLVRLHHDPSMRGFRFKASGKAFGTVVQFTTDVDRDGYGLLSVPPDPAPFDSAIYPYALDVPGNGIDENGVGGDLHADRAPYDEGASEPPLFTHRPPVVFIILESWRHDLPAARMNGREVTPFLNKLGREGVLTTRAYSHNGFTAQSRYHLFTGGLFGLREKTSLIDDFNANGYETACFSAQDESFGGELDAGFERASVRYDAREDKDLRASAFTTPGSLSVPFDVLEQRVVSFLEERDPSMPLFLHLFFQDTHFPYHNRSIEPLLNNIVLTRSQLRPSAREEIWAMYANTAANVDASIDRVIHAVERTTGQSPAVVVIADHGEDLFDHGALGHGTALNDAQTRVPLVVKGLPMRVVEPVGQSDLRDLFRQALSSVHPDTSPVVNSDPEKRVFQYLGQISHPRQIAFLDAADRILYDFHRERAKMSASHAWQIPEDMEPSDHELFLDLVHFWEWGLWSAFKNHRAAQ